MPTAKGHLLRVSASRITALFSVEGLQVSYTATMCPAMQRFNSRNAALTYGDLDDLAGTRSYIGRIGTESFVLTLANGSKIEGSIEPPGISSANTVTGFGAWGSS